MKNDLENIQHLNGYKYQNSDCKDDFIHRERQTDEGKRREDCSASGRAATIFNPT